MQLINDKGEKIAPNGETITRDEEGYFIDAYGRHGYNAHFTGAYVCYHCGLVCDCREDQE